MERVIWGSPRDSLPGRLMPAPLSLDLRLRFLKAYKNGEGSLRELARRFDIGEATADRWWSRHKVTGEIEARQMGGYRKRVIDADLDEVVRFLAFETPDATLEEYAEMFHVETGVRVSKATMGRTLRRLGLTRKKRHSTHQNAKRSE